VDCAIEIIHPHHKPAELLRHTSSGKLPLLLADGLALSESVVALEYLSESFGWTQAYPDGADARALHRMAMKQADDTLMAAWARGLCGAEASATQAAVVEENLDNLQRVVAGLDAAMPCLLTFHLAPAWSRWSWSKSKLCRQVGERPQLHAWLEAAIATPAVAETTPDRERTMAFAAEVHGVNVPL
jgi:glutathione S-transferase